MSFAVLGPVTFEVSADKVRTWKSAKRAKSARWHKHNVYAGKPKQEFLGPDLSTINLEVRLDINRGVDPKEEIKEMIEKLDTGEVMQFTVGGELIGDYVFKSVDDDWQRHSSKGEPQIVTVGLSIEEYA